VASPTLSSGKTPLRGWVVSLAPTFPAAYNDLGPFELVGRLYHLGAEQVVEVAQVLEGAIEARYRAAAERGPILFDSCPQIRNLVAEEFGHLQPFLHHAPPPAVLHARRLRQLYPGARVLFVGPCEHKVDEARRRGGADAVLSYRWLGRLLEGQDSGVHVQPTAPAGAGEVPPVMRLCVLHTGISGLSECRRILRTWPAGLTGRGGMELLACSGGCLAGEGMAASAGWSSTRCSLRRRMVGADHSGI